MLSERYREWGFAAAHDAPIPYLQRIRDYYQGLGYGAPYEWAHYADVPFRPLVKPLSRSRVTIITTAAPYQPDKGEQGPGAPYNAAAKFYTVYSGDTAKENDLRISHVAIDRKHTTAEDIGTYFPLSGLRQQAASGRIGSVAARFHGAPTNRSHRVSLEIDCPEIVARCKADGGDADWKLDYANIERLTSEEIERRRAEFDQGRAQAKGMRDEAGLTRPTADDEIA